MIKINIVEELKQQGLKKNINCCHANLLLQAAEIIEKLEQDAKRLDWLADTRQNLGAVSLPTECVLNNVHSMRDAIDAAMELDFKERYLENIGG
jgi:hypothetical protein